MANVNQWGFYNLRHLAVGRVSQVGIERVYDAVQSNIAEYNRSVTALLSEWVERVTVGQQQVELSGSGELQPLDNEGDGNPKPVRPSGAYTVGYPIQGAGTAFGDNRVTRALMTTQEVDRNVGEVRAMDARWITRHMLAALFTNTAYTFNDKIGPNGAAGLGDITVRPLAIAGDGITYGIKGGGAATDTHYLAQAAAIADASNPYSVIYAELIEHPSNGNGQITAYISSSLVATTQALASFVPVTANGVMYGANTSIAMGSEFENMGVGDRVLGYSNNVRIVEWAALPADYIVAKMDDVAPVAMREFPEASLQGLFPERHDVDGNHLAYRWIRYAGFGVRNRIGALVYRIGNASYAIPTGFSAPLAA
jgi:hypothetical protein